MITRTTAKKMTDEALIWSLNDIRETIDIQGLVAREYGMSATPKLGTYWDELYAVAEELQRRGLRA